MVVGLIFEHHEPFLFRAVVDADGNDDGSGVDFFGDFEVVELARGAEFAHADESDVHQGDGLVAAAEFFAGGKVGLPGALHGFAAFVEGDVFDLC